MAIDAGIFAKLARGQTALAIEILQKLAASHEMSSVARYFWQQWIAVIEVGRERHAPAASDPASHAIERRGSGATNVSSKLPDFTMRQLLETGVHFGHSRKHWNPKMKP
ncbi:hypothetical protein PMI11_06115, partial [Rhizobium sp. CF142]